MNVNDPEQVTGEKKAKFLKPQFKKFGSSVLHVVAVFFVLFTGLRPYVTCTVSGYWLCRLFIASSFRRYMLRS
jgi:hypothetical protein